MISKYLDKMLSIEGIYEIFITQDCLNGLFFEIKDNHFKQKNNMNLFNEKKFELNDFSK